MAPTLTESPSSVEEDAMQTLRIGLFGLPDAGKTTALAALYLAELAEGVEVTVRDTDTIRYLQPFSEALERGEILAPTMVNEPQRLNWEFSLESTTYQVETIDFAGELLNVIHQNDAVSGEMINRFRGDVRNWFLSCDGVILFIDGKDRSTVRYRDALLRLLDDISTQPTSHGSKQRAVAIVFTKADLHATNRDELADGERVREILGEHPLYDVIRRRLQRNSSIVQHNEFLVSALGWEFFSQPASKRKVNPANLFHSFRWVLKEAEGIVYKTHSQILDQVDEEIGEAGVTSFASGSIKRKLADLDREYRLSSGPLAGDLDQRQEDAHRKQRRILTLVALAELFLLLILCGGIWWKKGAEERRAFDQFAELRESTDSDSTGDAKRRLDAYHGTISPREWDRFWGLGGYRKKADAQAAEDAFFLWRERDREFESLGHVPVRHVDAIAYLNAYGRFASEINRGAVEAVRDTTKSAHEDDQRMWNEIATVKKVDQKVELLRKYLARPGALNAQIAKSTLKDALTGWDRSEYCELVKLSSQRLGADYITELAKAATDYLRSDRHTCSMRAPVERLSRQLDAIKGAGEYCVTVKSLQVPKESDLGEYLTYPTCSVAISVGGETRQTSRVKALKDSNEDFTITFNEELKPFYLTGGRCHVARVTVTRHGILADNLATRRVLESTLPLVALDGPLTLTCNQRTDLTVNLECLAARVDALPPFKTR